ncbi:MAG: hypothetical protein ABFS03_10430 [Chloroflexota bacterium]
MTENKKDSLQSAKDKIAANQAKKRAEATAAAQQKAEMAAKRSQADAQALRKSARGPREAVVVTKSLRVRSEHNTKSSVVDGLVRDQKVQVLTTWTDGDDTWAQLGRDKWAAMVYDGNTLMEFVV